MRPVLHAVIFLPLFSACASAPKANTPVPPSAQPHLSEAVHWVRNSAEHRAAYLQAFSLAERAVEQASRGLTPRTWAVILDADEAVIDNSEYQIEHGRGHYDIESWQAFARRRVSPPLPGARAFLEGVRARGGVIAIVTNRAEVICPDTETDFRAYAIPYDAMLCGSGDKNPRFDKVARGEAIPGLGPLRVVAWIGDNVRDFPGLDQPMWRKGDEAYAEFGTRFFLLPNPMYGSWEKNPEEGNAAAVANASLVDHVILGAADLDAGMAWLEARTGVRPILGGQHPGRGTRNALLALGGRRYLELLAPDPTQGPGPLTSELMKLATPKLVGWALAATDMESVAAHGRSAGIPLEGPNAGSRARPDGRLLEWRALASGELEGASVPFFIEWSAASVHPSADSPQGCRLVSLEVQRPDSARLRELLSALGSAVSVTQAATEGLSLRLDTPKGIVTLD
jgi:5'-nucleotidase (lipoprotein e(P4) family)